MNTSVAAIPCIFMEVNPFGHSGTYFRINMHGLMLCVIHSCIAAFHWLRGTTRDSFRTEVREVPS